MELIQLYIADAQYTDPEDYVISTRNRKTNTAKNISDVIKMMEKNAGTDVKDCNTHVLRHTCASLYFRAGNPTLLIAEILGNSVEVLEKTYIHFVEEQMQQAAATLPIHEI